MNGIRRAKGVRTTIPGKDGTRAADLLDRDFTAPAPNCTWVMDFTYCRTWAGFVYVSCIVDVFAQKIVAWHAATSKDVELVMTPLRMAIWQYEREGHPIERDVLIGHADAGSQYTSITFTEHLELEGIRPSTGAVADAFDNALMETVIGLFKTECIRTTVFHHRPYRHLTDVEWATVGWVDWYNSRRLHTSLDYSTPEEFETAHYAALNRELQAVKERHRTRGASAGPDETAGLAEATGRSRELVDGEPHEPEPRPRHDRAEHVQPELA